MAKRLTGRYGYHKENPFQVTFHPDKIDAPLNWRRPRRIFVVSMGDIFHKDVHDEWLDQIFNTIVKCKPLGHKFMLLTKRPENILSNPNTMRLLQEVLHLKNVWVGVTAENQETLDARVPLLLKVPAVIRFVSIEPMLSQINILRRYLTGISTPKLDWVICGGESGNSARPMRPEWVRSLRDQCIENQVPFFFKQWGTFAWQGDKPVKVGKKKSGRILDGRTWEQFPE
jgi:protein gp37